MIVLDANILLSAALGKHTLSTLRAAAANGISLSVPETQLAEAIRVLVRKFAASEDAARDLLAEATALIKVLEPDFYRTHEAAARERLHVRAQPDWPVLAAALAAEGSVWSHDRDFFGVGVPVWSSRNLRFAT